MATTGEWTAFECRCGFRLARVPRDVLDQIPRCLGCGRTLRAPPARVRSPASIDVRDLR